MTYQQTMQHLYARLPMFSRVGVAAYKEDLHNTVAICSALGDPQNKFKSIHIAGTNGKGSTSHMLAAILQQAGYKTGLYTSPHLKDFRERIKINGQMVSEDFIVSFVERTAALADLVEPSFFELTVGMAFDYFAREGVDVAVIETGLGGRLDSTNIVRPILSVITNIGFDHMNILGNTLGKIAYEKAGIIKRHTPVVVGEYLPETRPVFEDKAAEVQAPISFAADCYSISNIRHTPSALNCDITSVQHGQTENFTLDLPGLYQAKNLRTVLCAEAVFMEQGFAISNDAEKYALANVKTITGLHGRWEVIATKPMTVLDVAHNEDGVREVLRQAAAERINDRPTHGGHLHIITGMVQDKEVDRVLSMLPRDASYYFTNAHIPRAMKADELKARAEKHGVIGTVFSDVNDALRAARAAAGDNDLVLAFGSVFLVGEVDADAFR